VAWQIPIAIATIMDGVVSAKEKYFEMVGARDSRAVEDRVVAEIESALANRGFAETPVRLSPVARGFLIEPRPDLININHDGEISFDRGRGRFVIKMRRPDKEMTAVEMGKSSRYRFTYAHEVAHRFFFVQQADGGWSRALDCATENLDTAARLREKVMLSRLEESLCNRIAGRLLIPDRFVAERCNFDAWVSSGPNFYRYLKAAASDCAASPGTLLIRLSRSKKSSPSRTGTCAMIVDRSAGPPASRGRYTWRVTCASMPRDVNREETGFYPHLEVESFGSELSSFVTNNIAQREKLSGGIKVNFQIGDHPVRRLEGWWRLLGENPRRMMIWGVLA
jgi:hypothetical protein